MVSSKKRYVLWIASAIACLLPSASLANEIIIPFGAVWKYLDDGSDQGSAWVQADFDDSAWASGPGEFGYGEQDEATRVSFGNNGGEKYPTTYFRTTFQIDDPNTFPGLKISLLRDDGAVVYINGTEVHRSNMLPGEIGYLDLAAGPLASSEKIPDVFTVLPGVLVTGENSIAVEIHQESRGSSDLSFNLEATDGALPTPPILDIALLTMFSSGGSSLDLRASDCDDEDAGLSFEFSRVGSGRFELTSSPGVAISGTTQAQVTDGLVQFVPLEQSFGSAEIAGNVAEPSRIDEISGIVAAIRNPGVLWAAEDSDNPATLIALGADDASNRGEWMLDGAINLDWEDIAAAEVGGQALLYIGDFGDNGASRTSLQILRVREPLLVDTAGGVIPAADIETIQIQYPATPAGEGGFAPRDAESMIVDPHSGDIYILTKRETVGRLFFLRHQSTYTGVQTLEYLGELTAITHDTVQGFSASSTAADISRDGLEVVVRNYGHMQLFKRPDLNTSIAAMLTGNEIEDLPFVGISEELIGEAICFSADGGQIYSVAETSGANLPLFRYHRIPAGALPKFSVTVSDGVLQDGPHDATIIFDASPKDHWRHQFFSVAELGDPAQAGPLWGDLSDPDRDGRPNLLEYALGTDPRKADRASAIQVISAPDSLALSYTIDPSKTDITYLPQTSSDLLTWTTVTDVTVTTEGEIETRQATVTTGGSATVYLRLKVSNLD